METYLIVSLKLGCLVSNISWSLIMDLCHAFIFKLRCCNSIHIL